ncbi:MAG: hypothetical protein IT323_12235, partial [Anaerolineae bacterium]|nr:hypothetical protein [Anaerolineae bacterium]
MPRPVTGRRPDSLFDNRYRYDYIYPRGRSGETLRAYDTLHNNQPVVIKRPAPQDAPPMRAGQEVSLQNEKRALELLSGHPVLCELLHAGAFRVGGQSHMYLAIEMAQGQTLESMVLEAAARAERLPDLETLNIIEGLLDLLQAAHDHRLVYNDVDAKHLFWDRENYTLKMIDWGNAVFLGAEHAPAHVTRQSDLAQTGELMYFIFSGGGRLESGRPDPGGELPQDVDARLKAMINRAVHPDLAQRYQDAASMRRDLAEVRRPLHKNREALVERVRSRLSSATSQNQLEELRALADEALAVDPGYPAARALLAEVRTRLHQLALQSDLDAVRIYIESGNLAGAEALLDDLTGREDALTMPLLLFLQDACSQISLTNTGEGGAPLLADGLAPALAALFKDDPHGAARALLSTPEARPAARLQQMLLAERLTQRMPGVALLRPHLVRLEDMLARLPGAASNASATKLLGAVRTLLRKLDDPVAPGLRPLLGVYQHVADILVGLESELQASSADESRPGDTPVTVAARARQAADSIVELLEVTSGNALSDPSRAGAALWNAASIDPVQPAFTGINERLTALHEEIDELRKFAPAADGADIAEFLAGARKDLKPYAGEVTDPQYEAIVQGLESAASAWTRLGDAIALGGRRPALEACRAAADGARPLNKALAAWFDDLLRRIEEAPRTELLSPNAALGRALAEGYDAWDRGRGQEAMLAAKRAADAASTEAEKLAARRLIGLGETLDKWLEREGPTSLAQTEATERRILTLFLPEEEQIRATF